MSRCASRFYVMAIYELLGLLLGYLIIGAEEIDGLTNLIVRSKNICAILSHFRPAPFPVEQQIIAHKMHILSVRFQTQIQIRPLDISN